MHVCMRYLHTVVGWRGGGGAGGAQLYGAHALGELQRAHRLPCVTDQRRYLQYREVERVKEQSKYIIFIFYSLAIYSNIQ